jgi:hypothetical protein
VKILTTVRKAISHRATLLVLDLVLPGYGELKEEIIPQTGMNLMMQILLGGKERTPSEFEALGKKAGFRLARIIPTKLGPSIIEYAPN